MEDDFGQAKDGLQSVESEMESQPDDGGVGLDLEEALWKLDIPSGSCTYLEGAQSQFIPQLMGTELGHE